MANVDECLCCLNSRSRVGDRAKRFSKEIAEGVKPIEGCFAQPKSPNDAACLPLDGQ